MTCTNWLNSCICRQNDQQPTVYCEISTLDHASTKTDCIQARSCMMSLIETPRDDNKRQSSAIPPGRSLTVTVNLSSLPSTAKPLSKHRPKMVVSMLPPHKEKVIIGKLLPDPTKTQYHSPLLGPKMFREVLVSSKIKMTGENSCQSCCSCTFHNTLLQLNQSKNSNSDPLFLHYHLQCLYSQCHTSDKSSSSNRHYYGVNVGHLFDNFKTQSPLACHYMWVIVPAQIQQNNLNFTRTTKSKFSLFRKLHGDSLGLAHIVSLNNHRGPMLSARLDLHDGCHDGHHYRDWNLQVLPMIT
uniref:Uncharacterized protein n=1 Tax=Timema tahoe TaxID=61484 RepID=A0A7R9INR7_9NEOP|nr:unnamed protein product [Timema tahoe]